MKDWNDLIRERSAKKRSAGAEGTPTRTTRRWLDDGDACTRRGRINGGARGIRVDIAGRVVASAI